MKRKIRIGLFIDTFFPMVDGVINVVDNYARRLQKFCDVIVFAPEGRKEFDDLTLPYKVVRCKRKFPLKFLDYDLPLPKLDKEFKKKLDDADLDLVHIHSPFTIGKIGVKYAKQHKIPVVATMHSQFKQDFKKAVKLNGLTSLMVKNIIKVFNDCDECWAVNSEIAKIFVSYGAKTLPKVQNNGTEIVPYKDEKGISDLRQKLLIKENEKVLLFLGRLTALKNIFFIINSLKILKEKGFKFKMIFVGTGPDEQKLRNEIKRFDLVNEVILTGKIMDRVEISKYYKLADLFLFPSMYDASSLVQIEAASQGTPTIFLRGAATAATVTEDRNGFIAENSEKEFANKIIEIFRDKNKYDEICLNAFNEIYVSWDDVIEKAMNDYTRILKSFNNRRKDEK